MSIIASSAFSASSETLVGSTVVFDRRPDRHTHHPYNTKTAINVMEFPTATTLKRPRGVLYNRPDLKDTKHIREVAQICPQGDLEAKISTHLNAESFYQQLTEALVREWSEVVDCLEYSHMNAYYCGLSAWRNKTFDPSNNAFPATSVHNLRQTLQARVLMPRGRDEDFYDLQCSTFRHEQRKRLVEFTRHFRQLERAFVGKVPNKLLLTTRKVIELKRGLAIRNKFNPDEMSEPEVARRQSLAALKFGPQ